MKKNIYSHFIRLTGALSSINPAEPDNDNTLIITDPKTYEEGSDDLGNQSETTPKNSGIVPHGDWDFDTFKK